MSSFKDLAIGTKFVRKPVASGEIFIKITSDSAVSLLSGGLFFPLSDILCEVYTRDFVVSRGPIRFGDLRWGDYFYRNGSRKKYMKYLVFNNQKSSLDSRGVCVDSSECDFNADGETVEIPADELVVLCEGGFLQGISMKIKVKEYKTFTFGQLRMGQKFKTGDILHLRVNEKLALNLETGELFEMPVNQKCNLVKSEFSPVEGFQTFESLQGGECFIRCVGGMKKYMKYKPLTLTKVFLAFYLFWN